MKITVYSLSELEQKLAGKPFECLLVQSIDVNPHLVSLRSWLEWTRYRPGTAKSRDSELVPFSKIKRDYVLFCQDRGLEPALTSRIGRFLKSSGFVSLRRTHGTMHWCLKEGL